MLVENMQGQCWHCKQQLTSTDYQREARCPQCQKATHACSNCRYYQPGISNDCREPIAAHVSDKQRANFCDYFEPRQDANTVDSNPENLLQAADELFK